MEKRSWCADPKEEALPDPCCAERDAVISAEILPILERGPGYSKEKGRKVILIGKRGADNQLKAIDQKTATILRRT